MINQNKFDDFKTSIDIELSKCIPLGNNQYLNTIVNAMNYSLLSNGKRIRPILAMSVCEMFGDLDTQSVKFFTSIEMIHTYSLIHDDLPSMDNDDLRRGKPTLHIKFGEDIAILAGDALLNFAFENMIDISLNSSEKKKTNYLSAMKVISNASGYKGMILGQVADIKSDGDIATKDSLDFINLNKTGELIKASMIAGAILGNATSAQIDIIEKIAVNIGLAFQIVDDILDIEGNEKDLGKPIGSDSTNNKVTYPNLIGITK